MHNIRFLKTNMEIIFIGYRDFLYNIFFLRRFKNFPHEIFYFYYAYKMIDNLFDIFFHKIILVTT